MSDNAWDDPKVGHDPMCPVITPKRYGHCYWCEVIIKVRAEEQNNQFAERIEDRSDYGKALIREVLTDLRARVSALRNPVGAPSTLLWQPRNEAINEVLALLDKSINGRTDD